MDKIVRIAEAFAPLAGEIAKVGGLRWKVWSMNKAEREFGGIYLFDDEASANAFLAGPIVAQLGQHLALSDITAKQFDVLEKPVPSPVVRSGRPPPHGLQTFSHQQTLRIRPCRILSSFFWIRQKSWTGSSVCSIIGAQRKEVRP